MRPCAHPRSCFLEQGAFEGQISHEHLESAGLTVRVLLPVSGCDIVKTHKHCKSADGNIRVRETVLRMVFC
jgi:hypothetical protein